jgi:hypothetical protein
LLPVRPDDDLLHVREVGLQLEIDGRRLPGSHIHGFLRPIVTHERHRDCLLTGGDAGDFELSVGLRGRPNILRHDNNVCSGKLISRLGIRYLPPYGPPLLRERNYWEYQQRRHPR